MAEVMSKTISLNNGSKKKNNQPEKQLTDDRLIQSIKTRHPLLTDKEIEEEMAVIGF